MMTAFGTAIGSAITWIITTLGGLVSAFFGLPALIIAALAILITAILFNIDGFIEVFLNLFSNLFDSLKNIFIGGLDAVFSVFDLFFGLIEGLTTGNWTKFENGVKTFTKSVQDLFKGFFDLLIGNLIPFGLDFAGAFAKGLSNAFEAATELILKFIPQLENLFKLLGDIWGMITNLGGGVSGAISGATDFVNNFKIPGFAEGGIVNRPTLAMVGEAGPEAIIPLSGNKSNNFSAGTNVYAPQIYLNAVINNELDIREVADSINRYSSEDYARRNLA